MFAPFTMLDQGNYGLDFYWPEDADHNLPIDKDGQLHFKVTTRGPWSLIDSMRALAVETHGHALSYGRERTKAITVWGFRSLESPREDGYNYRGRVRVGGRRLKAFTSDQTITYQGKLTSLAILYAFKRTKED
jgi:hypothetical protein